MKTYLALTTAVLALVSANAAAAQDANVVGASSTAQEQQGTADPAATQPNGSAQAIGQEAGIGDVVVTAQRREQKLQDVPIAVSAFGASDLSRRQVVDTYDLLRNIPNMAGNQNVGVGTSSSYYLRAVGNGESIATFDVPVGTYVDDVYIARQNANNFALFDVERIEVLRGPQGTLFGRNTTGGAINIIMRKPKDKLAGYVEAGYGRFNEVLARGSIDIPLNDQILTKFSAFHIQDDGYARQVSTGRGFNSRDTSGGRGQVRLLPTSNLTIDLIGDYVFDQDTNFLNRVDANGNRVVDNNITQGSFVGLVTGPKANFGIDNKARSWSTSANIAWQIGGVTLNSITGYRSTTQKYIIDSGGFAPRPTKLTGFNPIINDSLHNQLSEELKLNGTALTGALTYVAGFYYLRETNRTDFAQFATNTTTFVQTVTADRTLKNNLDTYAGYAQADYQLVHGLTATAGLRYTYEHKTLDVATNPGALGAVLSDALILAAGVPLELNKSAWTPRFALTYRVDPDVMVYASATRGFKSGGWPGRSVTNAGFVPFKPETVWSYELGLRSDLLDRQLRFNATAFYATTYNVQIPAQIQTATGPVSSTTNPANLRNYGLELEALIVPVPNFNVSLSAGLQHARYVDIDPVVVAQQVRCKTGVVSTLPGCNANFVDRFGNIAFPVRAPSYTLTGLVSYDADIGVGTLTPSASFNFTSDYAIGTTGDPDQIDGSYTRSQTYLNASLTFRPAAIPNLSVIAECKNCLMENYPVSYLGVAFLDRPGTWMVRARYNF